MTILRWFIIGEAVVLAAVTVYALYLLVVARRTLRAWRK